MEIFGTIFWICLAIACGLWAGRLGRNSFGWFLLAFFLSPVIAAVFLVVLGSTRRCPHCGGGVPQEVVACKHCGRDL